MISVNIPLFIFTGRRHNFFSQGLKDETCRSCLMNRLKQSAFLNCFTPKSLVGSLCPWTTIEATLRNHSHPLLTNCQIPPITPSSSCSAQQDIILKIKFTLLFHNSLMNYWSCPISASHLTAFSKTCFSLLTLQKRFKKHLSSKKVDH